MGSIIILIALLLSLPCQNRSLMVVSGTIRFRPITRVNRAWKTEFG